MSKPLNLKGFCSQALSQNVFQSYQYVENWGKPRIFIFQMLIGVDDIEATAKDLNTFLYDLFNYKIVKREIVEQIKLQNKEAPGRGLMFIPFYERSRSRTTFIFIRVLRRK